MPGLNVQWKWAAAVYTSFSTDYNLLGVKPVDDNKASPTKTPTTPARRKTSKPTLQEVQPAAEERTTQEATAVLAVVATTPAPTATPTPTPLRVQLRLQLQLQLPLYNSESPLPLPLRRRPLRQPLAYPAANCVLLARQFARRPGSGLHSDRLCPEWQLDQFCHRHSGCAHRATQLGHFDCNYRRCEFMLVQFLDRGGGLHHEPYRRLSHYRNDLEYYTDQRRPRFRLFLRWLLQDCGVTINAVTNTAVITIGLTSFPFVPAAFSSWTSLPICLLFRSGLHNVSEDILWDAGRNLILSPNE